MCMILKAPTRGTYDLCSNQYFIVFDSIEKTAFSTKYVDIAHVILVLYKQLVIAYD